MPLFFAWIGVIFAVVPMAALSAESCSAEEVTEQASVQTRPVSPIKQTITDILKQPEFETYKEITEYVPIKKKTEKGHSFAWLETLSQWWQKAVYTLSAIVKWVLIALLTGLILYIIYRSRGLFAKNKSTEPYVAPETLFGLDVRPSSLPPNISEVAWQLWQAQEYRSALAMLYRGALAALIRKRVSLLASHTEEDCLYASRGKLAQETDRYFKQLTAVWQQAAYAQTLPEAKTMEVLCREFNIYFEVGS